MGIRTSGVTDPLGVEGRHPALPASAPLGELLVPGILWGFEPRAPPLGIFIFRSPGGASRQEIDDKIGAEDRTAKVASGAIIEEWDPDTLPGSNIMRYRHVTHGGKNTVLVEKTKSKRDELEGGDEAQRTKRTPFCSTNPPAHPSSPYNENKMCSPTPPHYEMKTHNNETIVGTIWKTVSLGNGEVIHGHGQRGGKQPRRRTPPQEGERGHSGAEGRQAECLGCVVCYADGVCGHLKP